MSSESVDGGMTVLGGAVDVAELFPGEWMRAHTEFSDFDAFVAAGEGAPMTRGGERTPGWNEHVASSTSFDDWGEMLGRALDDYRSRRASSATW